MSQAPAVYDVEQRHEARAIERLEPRSVALSQNDLDILRATVLSGASDQQLALYARMCRSQNLDPFGKEVYGFVNRDGGIELVVSIEGLRKRAEESGQYRGQTQQQWCGPDGEWRDIWLEKTSPAAARITVHREACEPFVGVATWGEFARPRSTNWSQYPTVMLSKCAEASAIRHLFPRQTSGLYIAEEIDPAVLQAARGPVVEAAARPAATARPSAPATAQPGAQRAARPAAPAQAAAGDGPPPESDEHTEAWRLYCWQRKGELGVTDPEFNAIRRRNRMPLLERMDVRQCRLLYEEMLNLSSGAYEGQSGELGPDGDVIDAEVVGAPQD